MPLNFYTTTELPDGRVLRRFLCRANDLRAAVTVYPGHANAHDTMKIVDELEVACLCDDSYGLVWIGTLGLLGEAADVEELPKCDSWIGPSEV